VVGGDYLMPPDQNIQELIYSPAKPGGEGYLIALAGPTGSGKTYSALRLARGIAGPDGIVALADTENGRARRYARDFTFERCSIGPPFRPEKYVAAAEGAKKLGAAVLIIDSTSHEHVGEGGILDWQAEELQRLAGNDFKRMEKMKGVSWIAPKRAHKAMLQRFIQLNFHVIFCLRAERKVDISLDPKTNKIEWTDIGFQPICGSDFMFDMTMSLMLRADPLEARGIPVPVKVDDQDRHLIFFDRPLDEETGARIAAKARGDQAPAPSPQQSKAPAKGATKNQAVAEALIAAFDAVADRTAYAALVDNEVTQGRLRWFREHRLDLFKLVEAARKAAWQRTPGDAPDPKLETTAKAKADQELATAKGLIEEIDKAIDGRMLTTTTGSMFFQAPMGEWKETRPELYKLVDDALKLKQSALKAAA
jgi:hypothetical protein